MNTCDITLVEEVAYAATKKQLKDAIAQTKQAMNKLRIPRAEFIEWVEYISILARVAKRKTR